LIEDRIDAILGSLRGWFWNDLRSNSSSVESSTVSGNDAMEVVGTADKTTAEDDQLFEEEIECVLKEMKSVRVQNR
jgi:hypothetical protein